MTYFTEKVFQQESYPVFAHPGETLAEHIEKCEKYLNRLWQEKDIEGILDRYAEAKFHAVPEAVKDFIRELFREMVFCHDTGKKTPQFQRNKMNNEKAPAESFFDGSTKHAMLSAVIYMDLFYGRIKTQAFTSTEKKWLRTVVKLNGYVISRHHSSLKSFGDFKKDLQSETGKALREALAEKGLCGYHLQNLRDKDLGGVMSFDQWDYFYCRFAYSILVACDYYATTEQMNGVACRSFGNLEDMEHLSHLYEESPLMEKIRRCEREGVTKAADEMNALRTRLFLEAEQAFLQNPNGDIYFLKAPTGSGKSNIALNLSFHMMKRGGRKLFYIYPFNTLVEQNRKNLMKLFAGETADTNIAVVNSLTPLSRWKGASEEENSEAYYQEILLDRQFLHYPMVLSTHVSFFDTLFGSHRESVLGFYQLSHSVVVLDEIQSYPPELWGELMLLLQCVTHLMGMKVIIMSATLPDLTILSGQCEGVIDLPENAESYFSDPLFLERVKVSTVLMEQEAFTLEHLKDHILTHHGKGQKVLVEFLTKQSAEDFYQMMMRCGGIGIPVRCMTGDDSQATRESVLAPIVSGEMKEVLLIATQVVEAGVDIDMDVGYKNCSKLDSEEQFLGRINRSCQKDGQAYFFRINDGRKIYKNDVRMEKNLTLENPEMAVVLQKKAFTEYYGKVLSRMKQFHIDRTDRKGIAYLQQNLLRELKFPEIGERMKIIKEDSPGQSVFFCRIIQLEDGTVLQGEEIWKTYKALLGNETISYSKKRVKLSELRAQMQYFIYQLRPNEEVLINDRIGELAYVEDGASYFENGRLRRELLSPQAVSMI